MPSMVPPILPASKHTDYALAPARLRRFGHGAGRRMLISVIAIATAWLISLACPARLPRCADVAGVV